MKTLLPRRPGVLMFLPPLIPQRFDCSTKVIHSSNSLSMFNPSSFKCFLVPRQCFNSGDPDADGCRTGPVEHFNDPRTLKSQASYGGRTHLNNHRHQFPGNVVRQRRKLACRESKRRRGRKRNGKNANEHRADGSGGSLGTGRAIGSEQNGRERDQSKTGLTLKVATGTDQSTQLDTRVRLAVVSTGRIREEKMRRHSVEEVSPTLPKYTGKA